MSEKKAFCRTLFLSMLRISACTFGGGFVIVPLLRKRFVDELHWLGEDEVLDLLSLAQSAPGPIAVNAALMLGYRIAGVRGALAAGMGTLLPPLVIISVISFFYKQFRDNAWVGAVLGGMQAGVAAIIANVVLELGGGICKTKNALSVVLMAAVFVAVYFFHIGIFPLLLFAAACGLAQGFLRARHGKKEAREDAQ